MKYDIWNKSACIAVIVVMFPFMGKTQNPVIQTIYTADPAPMVHNGTLYLYTGHDEDKSTWFTMKDWYCYSTTDMVNWTDRGVALSLKTFGWANKDAWAGQCIFRDGKFYWYVPINQSNGKGMAIGVAVSDRPEGPFKDALGKPMISDGWGYIDPSVFIDDDGQAYLYWGNPHLYYVKLNKDMVSYDQKAGIVKEQLTAKGFKPRVINAEKTFAWAKSIDCEAAHCVKNAANNKYYWYVSAIDKNTNKKVIGVAIGSNPRGPFTDLLGKPFITDNCGDGNINPTVVRDDAKQSYLTWGASVLWHVKLNEDMVSYDMGLGIQQVAADKKDWFASKIKGAENSSEKRQTTYEEAPWLFKRNNKYYLLYAAGGVPEHLAYSTSTSPTGPWTYGDTIMSVIKKGGAFTNHPGYVDYKGKSYFFYHNAALPGGGGFARSVCVDEFKFNADGSMPRIAPTPGIIEAVGKVNPFVRVEAETIAWEEGVEAVKDEKTGIYVTDISNGDYIKVRQVDFGKGANLFQAAVASMSDGGNIGIRIDSLTGTLLGNCAVKKSGGMLTWSVQSCKTKKVEGIHDVFLVFQGGSGNLFNFDWWKLK
jgi:arabinoxylan arabinofuranohydrolase